MTISIKTTEQIEKMRVAGKLAAEVLEMIGEFVKPGISTGEIDQICHDYIVNTQNAIPACLGYRGFPRSICTSVNHVVCHGIPDEKKILRDGDIINIDVTVIKDGFFGDTSKMFTVGKIDRQAERLIQVTQEALYLGIEMVKPGAALNDIGSAIEKHAHAHQYSVVRDYCGHGIGESFHEAPQVLHYGSPKAKETLCAGMCFTIEPMLNLGTHEVRLLPDKWTVITKDRQLSAQWEHTLLVTETGVEVLTRRSDESFR